EIWQAADKILYSRTLDKTSSARTRIERDLDPEAVRQMKASAERDITVAGPDLAAHAIKAGLVDEYQLFIVPVVVGGGKRSLPNIGRPRPELRETGFSATARFPPRFPPKRGRLKTGRRPAGAARA